MGNKPAWRLYQEEVASFFRSLGLDADTDTTVTGVRTNHDVDVVVTGQFAGFEVRWLVECKRWRTRIAKDKVLLLRSIVDDTGADRGLIMAESGYQRGALEAARLANVALTSLADLRETCTYDLGIERLRHHVVRADMLRARYWRLPKAFRIEVGLRGDWDPRAYSAKTVLDAVDVCLRRSLFYGFPAIYDEMLAFLVYAGNQAEAFEPQASTVVADTPSHLADHIDNLLGDLEGRLIAAEAIYSARGNNLEPLELDPRPRI